MNAPAMPLDRRLTPAKLQDERRPPATRRTRPGAGDMDESTRAALFEQAILPHMNAAYNLARWIVRDPGDAEDVVQESFIRAFRSFSKFHGDDGRAWLLAIVRNACLTWLRR